MGCLHPFPFTSTQFISDHWIYLFRGIFGFAAGFSLCSILRARPDHNKRLLTVVGFASKISMVVILAVQLPNGCLIPMFFILVYCSAPNTTLLSHMLSIRPLSYLGERSYSIYLIHFPLIFLFSKLFLFPHPDGAGGWQRPFVYRAIFCIVIGTFTLAEVSYRFFECPVRDMIRLKVAARSIG
jgi:peptidoglycan/LPS O-acetylase OafA/YrhL